MAADLTASAYPGAFYPGQVYPGQIGVPAVTTPLPLYRRSTRGWFQPVRNLP